MPNRIIRDALLDSERYNALPLDARLAFIEILLRADDYGLIHLSHIWLKRRIPIFEGRSPGFIDGILLALADQDLIRVYEVEKTRYAFIPQFGNRPQSLRSKFPHPPECVDSGAVAKLAATAKNLYRKKKHLTENAAGTPGCAAAELRITNTEGTTTQDVVSLGVVSTSKKKIRASPDSPPASISVEIWNDWLQVRKRKGLKAPTPTAWKAIVREAERARLSPADAVRISAENEWAGFKASWLQRPEYRNGHANGHATPVLAWHQTSSGVRDKGAEFGIHPEKFTLNDGTGRQDWQAFRAAVLAQAGVTA